MEMCRACMSSDVELLKFDPVSLDNYNILTDLSIKLGDNLPQSLCQMCWDAVDLFIKFRKKCIVSESSLLKIIKNQQVIKSESNELENDKKDYVMVTIENVKVEPQDNEFDKYVDETHSNDDDDDDDDEDEDDDDHSTKQNHAPNIKIEFTEVPVSGGNGQPKPKQGIKRKKNKDGEPKTKKTKAMKIKKEPKIVKFECGLCHSDSYPDKVSLRAHLEEHKANTQCCICEETFKDWPKMMVHRFTHLSSPKKCHICWTNYKTDYILEYHYFRIHYDKNFTGIPCAQCEFLAPTPRHLSRHNWYNHAKEPIICPVCSIEFTNTQRLKSHMKRHSDVKEFQCELCDFSCKYSGGMTMHKLRRHGIDKNYCRKCQRFFKSPHLMEGHTCAQHTLCPHCGKDFESYKIFKRHMRAHSEERPYKCDRCPASFKCRTPLVVHINKHDGNRTEKCQYCPATFYSRNVLVKHIRTHTGEKPYVCHICERAFTGSHNLKVHMKVHGEMLITKKDAIDCESASTTSYAHFQ